MSTNPNYYNSVYSPGIQTMIPMIYVAWLDGILSPEEVAVLKEQALQMSFLTEEDRKMLKSWTSARQQPSRQIFKYWEIELRNAAANIDSKTSPSLVDLGLMMAQTAASGQKNGLNTVDWKSNTIRQELEAIEERLGGISVEAYRNIFSDYQEKQLEEEALRSSFDIQAMKAFLDRDQQQLKDELRSLFETPDFKLQNKRIKEEYRDLVLEWCKKLADKGLGGLSYPKAYGGNDDMAAYATIFEMLGHHDLSLAIKYGVQFGLFGGSVLALGTEQHHKKYLADIGTLQLPGCFAMTETGHGSNVRGLETTATFNADRGTFTVHSPRFEAGKEYIGNALHGRMASVFAQLIVGGKNHGVHAILVPLRNEQGEVLPGITVKDNGYKLGLNGVDNGRIWFDQVEVPRENLLNRFGDVDGNGNYSSPIENPSRRFFTMLGTLVGGRVCVPRAGLSAAKTGLNIAINYALKRRQFAANFHDPETLLLDYPSHQRRLMPLLAKTYALDIALDYLTRRYFKRSEEDIREIESMAAGLKAYATWFTTEALQECREACGGKGYLAENRFADLKADTEIFTTFEGDNVVLLQLVAKGVVSEFKKEFHEDGVRALLRFVGNRISTSIVEQNPFAIRNTDSAHLLSDEFHLNAFRFRERKMLFSVSQRLRGWIKEGMTSYEAFLKCQNHMIELGKAYAERIVIEQFVAQKASVEDQDLKLILDKLCALYALHTLEQHKGWYLEHDYMTGNKTKAIRRMIDQLCGELRLEAGALVKAFAIPNASLAAPIATISSKKS